MSLTAVNDQLLRAVSGVDEQQPGILAIHPDEQTYAWLTWLAGELYDGDLATCIAAVLKAAMERQRYYLSQGMAPGEEPYDPWGSLEAQLPIKRRQPRS
jgi:hypothetical protein